MNWRKWSQLRSGERTTFPGAERTKSWNMGFWSKHQTSGAAMPAPWCFPLLTGMDVTLLGAPHTPCGTSSRADRLEGYSPVR